MYTQHMVSVEITNTSMSIWIREDFKHLSFVLNWQPVVSEIFFSIHIWHYKLIHTEKSPWYH